MAFDENFEQAVAVVLEHEGGYVNDPEDLGGETKYGISKKTYPTTNIKDLTVEQAKEIYWQDWWDKYKVGRISHVPLATKLFDLSINMGAARAKSLLREALNAIEVRIQPTGTAEITPNFAKLVNSYPDQQKILLAFQLQAVRYYNSLKKTKYLSGWITRALS